ncbi:MFS transporter [Actinoplanes couchii]|uniref:MFS transporter n=1 Tax=Actinoplanes couchii TaxID=403638 RepID=A0ABQ3X8E5_9ACTN|nr:MFS transporter [Actinoplanes couchii]MDR6320197.1 MFS family permease [Actinoplanes couchii]GID54789.1 MFS transporter [Actinoplanes couchii]
MRRYVWLLLAAQFGVFLALVTPIAISLAIKVEQVAPGNPEYLGYATGCGALAAIVSAPLFGMLSDRTRSRFGRRRPWFALGTLIGAVALVVMALAGDIVTLGLGWVLAQIGWGSLIALLLTSMADRLPEDQRGRISGLGGMVSQLAPILGAILAGGLAGNDLLLFLVPGGVGIVTMALFLLFVSEPDSRELPPGAPMSLAELRHTYLFDVRRHTDFAWNWLGKFLFFFGLTLNTTFSAFFLADRMGTTVQEVAGTVAILGIGGIVTAMIGAIGGGFLSDRLKRRRIFVLLGAAVFATGTTGMVLAPTLPLIIGAAMISNLGIGLFASVDQALALDVLPDRETDAGRYVGIYAFSTTLGQGLAPFLAPVLLGGDRNYTVLYLAAAAITLVGGLTVFFKIKAVR